MPARFLFAFLLTCPAVAAASPVSRMSVRLSLDADGALTVVETITTAQGASSGFYREIPAQRVRLSGLRSLSRVSLIDARSGGEPAAVSLRRTERGLRADFPPAAAPGGYDLVYSVENALGFFPDRDELHWTAAPNEWGGALEGVDVEFDLDGRALQSAAGRAGSADILGVERSGVLRFSSALAPKEALRITAAFPPHTFPRPGDDARRRRLLADNLHLAVGAFGLALFFIWASRARAKAVTPPESLARADGLPSGLSAAAARYCAFGTADAPALAAALLSCETAGYLKLEDGRVSLGDESARNKLWGEERAAADGLLDGRKAADADGVSLERALASLRKSLEAQWLPRLAAVRFELALPGWALTAGIFAAMRAAADPRGGAWPALACGLAVALLGILVAGLWIATYWAWKEASSPANPRRFAVSLAAVILGCVSFGAVTWAADVLRRLYLDASPLLIAEAAIYLLANMAALAALRGPTPDGWLALNQASALRSLRADQLICDGDLSFAAAFEAPVGEKAPEELKRAMRLIEPLRGIS